MPLLYISTGIAILVVYLTVPVLTSTTFYAFFYSLMFMWSRNMINIQLYYITKQKYRVFNRGTLSFLVLSAFYAVFHNILKINSDWYFVLVFVVEAAIFFEFVTSVLN